MVDKVKKVWMDGHFVDWDDANVHILTHSLHYGLAAFEGIRAYKRTGAAAGNGAGSHIFRLDAHIERLLDSCKMALIPPRFTREQISAACVDVMRQNHLFDGYLRPIVYVGEGAMGVYAPDNPIRTMIVAWKWGSYLGQGAVEHGIRAKVASWARHHIHVSMPRGKIMGQYTNSTLAKREAKMGGYDEAILMDVNGYVSEGSGENLFIVKRGKLITPPLSASILEGVTRDTILTLAREEGIPVSEEMVTRDQLYLADEAFFTGTAAEITPIREIDDRRIGEGTVGPVTKRMQQRFFDVVKGSDASHPEWLTRV
jgi:branched-chain amino acid aminotransferase